MQATSPGLRRGSYRQDVGQRRDGRERVHADRRVGQRWVERMPGKSLDEIPQLHTQVLADPAVEETLLGVRLEEAQERGVLAEEVFDLRDAGACPVLDPGLGEVILDVMEAALVHSVMIGQKRGV